MLRFSGCPLPRGRDAMAITSWRKEKHDWGKFWPKVLRKPGCWTWLAGKNTAGYGSFWFHGRLVMAHRVSWMLEHGPIPDGLFVLHHCDNPPCVNPKHLFLGTARDNLIDAISKGRHHAPQPRHGEQNSSAKLTQQYVSKMRHLRCQGKTYQQIADLFGICKRTALLACKGITWKHVA